MHPVGQNDVPKQKNKDKVLKEKNELLLKLGLFEKEYAEQEGYSPDYPERERDPQTGRNRYFRKVPISVSEEAYRELQKCQDNLSRRKPGKNAISRTLEILAWVIFVGGFLIGILLGVNEATYIVGEVKTFSFAVAATYWTVSFTSGLTFLALSEILRLLTEIKVLRGNHTDL